MGTIDYPNSVLSHIFPIKYLVKLINDNQRGTRKEIIDPLLYVLRHRSLL